MCFAARDTLGTPLAFPPSHVLVLPERTGYGPFAAAKRGSRRSQRTLDPLMFALRAFPVRLIELLTQKSAHEE
jgi:hypothetical protein